MSLPEDIRYLSYTDDLDPEDQIDMEERIADYLFHDFPSQWSIEGEDLEEISEERGEEWCTGMSKDILLMVLSYFRPDLITSTRIPYKTYDDVEEDDS